MGDTQENSAILPKAPCSVHWVCTEDVFDFFERATADESLFPPKFCGYWFLLHDYREHVDPAVAKAYLAKAVGEYKVLAKNRIYCAEPSCGKFLHPGLHVKDATLRVLVAVCDSKGCECKTCCLCKTIIETSAQSHVCKIDQKAKKIKQTARRYGYQECFACGNAVELREAYNHIECTCGREFCYICGKEWSGVHGCPRYGSARFNTEDYDQDGFHHDTGLNRERQARVQQAALLEEQHNRAIGPVYRFWSPQDSEEQIIDNQISPQLIERILSLVHAGRILVDDDGDIDIPINVVEEWAIDAAPVRRHTQDELSAGPIGRLAFLVAQVMVNARRNARTTSDQNDEEDFLMVTRPESGNPLTLIDLSEFEFV